MSIVTSLWRWLADMLRRHFAAQPNTTPVTPPVPGVNAAILLLLLLEDA